MLRRWGVLGLAATLSAAIAPLPAKGQPTGTPGEPGEHRAAVTAQWRGDRVVRGGDRLDVPEPAALAAGPSPSRGTGARAPARLRYALSYVVVPIKGMRLRFSRARVRAMTGRVAARTAQQTGGRITYGFASYTRAPAERAAGLTCDLDVLNAQFRGHAKYRRQPPPGFGDTIVVYLTPPRFACAFAGIAYLGGSRVYLNGLTLDDPQRLQDWITAHELGHTLGLDHSASFWLRDSDWTPGRLIPASRSGQEFADYGDYLDVMGQPPRGGYRLRGTRFGNWLLDGPDLLQLGVLGDTNAPTIRASGTYRLNRLSPERTGGRMMVAIPVRANGSRTFWVLEYRPASLNAALRYPAPWATRAYGVRLILAGHGSRYSTAVNKTFHHTHLEDAYGNLPVGRDIRLGGGSVVRVNRVDASGASVTVSLP